MSGGLAGKWREGAKQMWADGDNGESVGTADCADQLETLVRAWDLSGKPSEETKRLVHEYFGTASGLSEMQTFAGFVLAETRKSLAAELIGTEGK